ncbi:PPK2 family polyphosphate kinase [Gemmatimonas sp.]|uniref:PPK2 family polyphosphate kinase n=1 Tax=Gemmatimonas sp. TaxID=1962908 RepID=UPI003DA6B52B
MPKDLPAAWRVSAVSAGEQVALGSNAARIENAPGKKELEVATQSLLSRLAELQEAFHADGRHSLLLVLQGRDASGKDGVIKSVYGAFNPTGVRVAAFGPPSSLELKHDFLWRVHQVVPPRGMIGVFNRSHYEDVLAVRVRKLAPETVWQPRFEQINHFEQMLHENGVIIRKCFLHISREEQRERLLARLDDPHKNWKFRLEDLDDRALWDEYTDAYRDVLAKCSTPDTPWFVIPADEKAVRNYLVARMLVDTLEAVNPTYPAMQQAVRDAARDFK